MNKYLLIATVLFSCKSSDKPKDAGVREDATIIDAVLVDASIPIDIGSPDVPVLNSLELIINTFGNPNSNCLADGTSIETMAVKMIPNSSNVCTPVHITHLRVNNVLEEYDTICPEPEQKACFEKTDRLIMPLAPGGYHVIVTGIVDGKPCWIGDASVGIPPEGRTAQSLDLLPQDNCP